MMLSTKTRTRSAAALGAAAALSFGIPPAIADSDGAQIINQSGCEVGGSAVVCGTEHAESNAATTPNGNFSYQGNGKYDFTVTYPGGSYTTTGYFVYHILLKQGEPQEFRQHSSVTTQVSGVGSCTYSLDYHYANGKYQFDHINYVCTP